MVMFELPAPGAGIVLGLKLTPIPEGMPEAVRAILLLNPLLTVVVMVEFPWVPCTMVSRPGEADSVKLGCPLAVTVKANVAVCLIPPPTALTVMVYFPTGARRNTATLMVALPAPGAPIMRGLKPTATP